MGTADPTRVLSMLERLPVLRDELRGSEHVRELFAIAARLAREEYGFSRALVIAHGDGLLTAGDSGVLADPASDTLRRRMLAEPIPIAPETEEAELVRRRRGRQQRRRPRASVLAEVLGLEHHVFGVIAPGPVTVALLVVDRSEPSVGDLDRVGIETFAAMVAGVLERVLLRQRISRLSMEMRDLATAAGVLAREALDAPLGLPSGHRVGAARAAFDMSVPVVVGDRVGEQLSERELRVAALLMSGLSNRQIAEELVVSPETVKKHVAHILRKLGASNRVEAVARLMQRGD